MNGFNPSLSPKEVYIGGSEKHGYFQNKGLAVSDMCQIQTCAR
jgi:hypothetical protein